MTGSDLGDGDRQRRRTGRPVLDEATRPRLPRPPEPAETPLGRANARALVQIHDQLRGQLEQVRSVVAPPVVPGARRAETV